MTLKIETIPLKELREHPSNRKRFDAARLEELTANVKEKGILTPLLVRKNGKCYEVIAGARRLRAALGAGLAEVPAIVRELDDREALELLVIDNLQREDVHPLEEAEGYLLLHEKHKCTVEQLAAKVGKSVAYVYARMKLCELTKEAKKAFLEDRITAGHAVLLARLKPEDQARALDPGQQALFDFEDTLPLLDDAGQEARHVRGDDLKARSVREFEAWIDGHVRFDTEKVDQMVFPETAETIEAAKEEDAKVLAITHEYVIPDGARADTRTITSRSWKRADGKGKSKTCEHAQVGVIVVGPGRGQAFKVCVAKEKCKVHWAAEQKEKAKRAKAPQGDREAVYKKQQEERRLKHERQKAERARWEKAMPALAEATAERVKTAPVKASGFLAKLILDRLKREPWMSRGKNVSDALKLVPEGSTAEDVVRRAAWLVFMEEFADSWGMADVLPPRLKALGIDAKKILDEHAPVEKKEPEKAGKGKASKRKPAVRKCRECGCTEEEACEGGCEWVEPDLCSACA